MASTIAVVIAAVALTAAGLFGAYGYGRDYSLHRGFATLARLPRAGTGRLLTVQFYSQALQRRADYMIYLPPGYSTSRRYPVYYLLHGMPGRPNVFVDIANMDVRLDNQLSLHHARPMILVYPDGRIGGSTFSDSEWANTPKGAFENYVIEVMHSVDRRFSTLARRQDRVIAGFSSGAYGAINIALHHLSDFASVQSWSGYFIQTRSGVFAKATPQALAYNSPFEYLTRLGPRVLATDPLRVYMFVGRDDDVSVQQQPMLEALRDAGARVEYRTYPGGHDWAVWYPRLNQMLDLASEQTAHPLHPLLGRLAVAPRAPLSISALTSHPHGLSHHPRSELRLLSALLLALLSGALINLGFVLQQRGHANARASGHSGLAAGFRDRSWLVGQGIGWAGFLGQIVAIALAPLTLVQAFCAGSLALSVPLAARLVGERVRREQLAIIAIIAVSLVSLPIGFAAGHGHLHGGVLIAAAMIAMLAGASLAPAAGTAARAIAAGVLYGVADAAIKADAVMIHLHGIPGLFSGWSALAALCTFGGFLCFQAALQSRDAVRPVSLMNALTAVAAAALGVIAFGEPIGTSPLAGAVHIFAIAVVLACVRPLTRAQQLYARPLEAAASGGGPRRLMLGPRVRGGTRHMLASASSGLRRAPRTVATSSLAAAALVVSVVSTTGLLYALRGLHVVGFGPSVPDALPLLQLAGFAAQPVLLVVLAGLAPGVILGLALARMSRRRRLVMVGIAGTSLLLAASDASYALAHNLRLDQVLLNRAPGLGPWLQGALLAAGSVIVSTRTSPALSARAGGLIAALRGPQWTLRPAGPILAERRLVLVPLIALGFSAAVLAATILPGEHAGATTKLRHRAAGKVEPDAGHLFYVDFYSRALRRQADYLVYLPTGYRRSHRLPVFYMLHGMPGRPMAFTVNANTESKLERLIQQRRIAPMILVFPDGRINGNTQTDSEWANTRAGDYESYVVDVIHDVDHRFATLPYRQDRAIAGLSAGAYGAINVGLHQVALIGLIQVWSGYFVQTHSGVFAGATPRELDYNSPMYYGWAMRQTLAEYPLRAFLYVGRGERDAGYTPLMTQLLRDEGADAHYAIYAGGHSWKLWAPRVGQMLIMASRFFARRPHPGIAAVSGSHRLYREHRHAVHGQHA